MFFRHAAPTELSGYLISGAINMSRLRRLHVRLQTMAVSSLNCAVITSRNLEYRAERSPFRHIVAR